jgi:hypothetical protein
MTDLHLTPNTFLFHLLTNLLIGLTALNKDDPSLRQVADKINHCLLGAIISGEELLKTLHQAKEIVSSYGIKPKGDLPSNDPVADLPGILYNAINEVDHLITKEQVMDKISMERKITKIWEKLAAYHSLSK